MAVRSNTNKSSTGFAERLFQLGAAGAVLAFLFVDGVAEARSTARGAPKLVKTVKVCDSRSGENYGPVTDWESKRYLLEMGDKVSVKLSAFHQEMTGEQEVSPDATYRTYTVGQHNIPALNAGVVGACKGETRQIVTQTHDKSSAIAYLVHVQKVIKKVVDLAEEAAAASAAAEPASGPKEVGDGSYSNPRKVRGDVREQERAEPAKDYARADFAVEDTFADEDFEPGTVKTVSAETGSIFEPLTRSSTNYARKLQDEAMDQQKESIEADATLSYIFKQQKEIGEAAAREAERKEREMQHVSVDEDGERTPDDEI